MPNKKTIVRTNSTPNSTKEVLLKALIFQELWDAYPKFDPCNGHYRDQCAARLGEALRGCGIEGLSFKGARCGVDHPSHMLRAAEVAEWLHRRPFAGCPQAASLTPKTWDSDIKGQTGIVFFDGYWHRDSDGPEVTTGNHIDLWNGSRLTMARVADTLATIGRFVFGRQSLGAGTDLGYSDLHGSNRILFWEVK
jgi:hypothetical protein